MKRKRRGISLDGLSKYYDLVTPAERSRFRRKQIELSGLRAGYRVLDIGCGTGALTILARIVAGEAGEAAGIDIAPGMISKARNKASRAGLDIDFRVASVDELPYPDGHFDLVISSMMFHHLPVPTKERGLLEIRRVLKARGRFFLCDFLTPHPLTAVFLFLLLVWIRPTRFQLFGKLPGLIGRCGFSPPELAEQGLFLKYRRFTKA